MDPTLPRCVTGGLCIETTLPLEPLRETGVPHDRIFHAPLRSDAFVLHPSSALSARDPSAPRLAGVQRHEIRDILLHTLRAPPTLPNRLRLAYIMPAVKQRGHCHSGALLRCRRIPHDQRATGNMPGESSMTFGLGRSPPSHPTETRTYLTTSHSRAGSIDT